MRPCLRQTLAVNVTVLEVNMFISTEFSTALLTPTVLYWEPFAMPNTAGLQFHTVPAGGDRVPLAPFQTHTGGWAVLVLQAGES